MKPAFVVDVGNSRIKWGRCRDDRVVEMVSLLHDDAAAWQVQLERWQANDTSSWVVSGVNPAQRDRLSEWLRAHGSPVLLLKDPPQLPLRVLLPAPEKVGIDRLLNAVAARTRQRPGIPMVLVGAGTAVTVDYLDDTGAFAGGAIFPGLNLMAESLRKNTALLPLIEVRHEKPRVPATSTPAAIEAGVFWAVAGGIRALTEQLAEQSAASPDVLLTGGDAPLLRSGLPESTVLWPEMTLEGVRIAAESASAS